MIAAAICPSHANELRDYYEAQKAELLASFQAPAIGSPVSVKLATGQIRTGNLNALTADAVTIDMPVGPITYKKELLDNATRMKLFAEDYAHIVAVQRTRQLKASKMAANKPKQATVHSARISVKDKLDKDKNTEKIEGKQNPNSDRAAKVTRKTTEKQTYNLDITLSNTSANPDTYQLEWYFMSRGVGSKSASTMCEKGSQEFSIEGKKRIQHTVTSKTLTSGTSKESGGNDKGDKGSKKPSASGSVYTGYVVLVKHGDTILAKDSNNNSFLKEDWLAKLNAPAVAAPAYVASSGTKKKKGKKKKKKKDE